MIAPRALLALGFTLILSAPAGAAMPLLDVETDERAEASLVSIGVSGGSRGEEDVRLTDNVGFTSLAVSLWGPASGGVAVSVFGPSEGPTAMSAFGDAKGVSALSLAGHATGTAEALSATGEATCEDATCLAFGGCNGARESVWGNPVEIPAILPCARAGAWEGTYTGAPGTFGVAAGATTSCKTDPTAGRGGAKVGFACLRPASDARGIAVRATDATGLPTAGWIYVPSSGVIQVFCGEIVRELAPHEPYVLVAFDGGLPAAGCARHYGLATAATTGTYAISFA